MQLQKFFPTSNDPYLKVESDMALAKFGHINELLKYIPATARTTSTLTITNSTTLENAPGLSVNVEAGGVYSIQAYLPMITGGNSGAKISIAGSAIKKSTEERSVFYGPSGSTTGYVKIAANTSVTQGASMGASGVSSNAFTMITVNATIEISTSGTLQIMFAQDTASGSDTKLFENSTMIVTRIV